MQLTIQGWILNIFPGECNGLIQPLDVGMNKLLKCANKMKWVDWMMDVELNGDTTTPHLPEDVAE